MKININVAKWSWKLEENNNEMKEMAGEASKWNRKQRKKWRRRRNDQKKWRHQWKWNLAAKMKRTIMAYGAENENERNGGGHENAKASWAIGKRRLKEEKCLGENRRQWRRRSEHGGGGSLENGILYRKKMKSEKAASKNRMKKRRKWKWRSEETESGSWNRNGGCRKSWWKWSVA